MLEVSLPAKPRSPRRCEPWQLRLRFSTAPTPLPAPRLRPAPLRPVTRIYLNGFVGIAVNESPSSYGSGQRAVRLAVLTSHPVQYYGPLFRELAKAVDLHV